MIRSLATAALAWALAFAAQDGMAQATARASLATDSVGAPLPAAEPVSAELRGDRLLLRYAVGVETLVMTAAWPETDPTPAEHQYRTAGLDVFEGSFADLKGDAMSVPLRSRTDWDSLVRDVLLQLAPSDPRDAAAIVVQGDEVLVSRDASGALRIWQLGDKPSGIRVTGGVSEREFAARAMAVARERAGGAAPVLFMTGEADGAASFVLFLFDRDATVLLAAAPSPDPGDAARSLGLSVRLLSSVVLKGQALAALKSPVSSTARLLAIVGHSGFEFVSSAGFIPDAPPPPLADASPMDAAAFEARLDRLTGARRYPGRIRFLVDGSAYFPALVQAIAEASRSIDVRVYIFDVDPYALRIADLLKQRSAAIPVRVLVDDMATLVAGALGPPLGGPAGTRRPGSIEQYLRSDSRVAVRARPNPGLTGDHTKTIVFDGRLAFLGGMNIGREYRFDWHDLMIEVGGPIAARLQRDFDVAWAHAGLAGDLGLMVASAGRSDEGPPRRAAPDEAMLRPLYTATARPEIYLAQLAAIREARQSIWIENAYLADNTIANELVRARRRGVDVRVVLPTAGDSRFMNASNLVTANYLVRNGVRVYAYPGMTHVKAAVFDGWACFGSANFDKMSLKVNLETNLGTSDPEVVRRLREELFERDFRRSRELTGTRPAGFADYFSEFIANQL
ncbi:MAG: phosphatidylserine/phosphatidylglycerophosphate/cardiolipin synthase family protein [Burkholderiales bacterium]|jgi:cardiolipin synthase|nr:phosphatidylserine/phosphatidylglycerophosphate/cardiolipin synthase family protein [Burkholderiales bacterium]